MFKKILNKHHLGSYSSDKSKSLQGGNMTIILVILLFLYIGLKIIFSDDETDSNDQDKLKEISIKVEDRNETDSTTNMIIYSSFSDSSAHSTHDCSGINSSSCECHSIDSHNCDL
jgi:hypothetical protein